MKKSDAFNIYGSISLLTAALLYSFVGIIARPIANNFPFFYQFWTRYVVIIFMASALLVVNKSWKKIKNKDLKWFFIRTLAGEFSYVTFFFSFLHLRISTVYLIFYSGIVISGFIIGKLFFKSKINKLEKISLISALLGLLIVYADHINVDKIIFVLIALASGAATSCWNIFSKKVSGRYSIDQVIFLDMILAFPISFGMSLILREEWTPVSFSFPWLLSLILAVIIFLTGYLVVFGFKFLKAQVGSLIMLAEIVFAVFLGFIFVKEPIDFKTILGSVFIFIAVCLPEINYVKSSKFFSHFFVE